MNQLSFFPQTQTRPRKYIRDHQGRFANKGKLEIEEAKRAALRYCLLYEAEQRKLKPLLKRLIEAERELSIYKTVTQ